MPKNFEYKSLNVEIKSFDKIKGIFKGYASSFNQIDKVNDTVDPTAFDKSIEQFENGTKFIKVNYDHWSEIEFSDNLMSISKDDFGLIVEFQVSDEAKETYEERYAEIITLAEIGKLFMSIGGWIEKSSLGENRWVKKEIGKAKDTILEFDLDHVAITEYPIDSNAKMLEVKSRNKVKKSSDLSTVDGEVSAIKYLTSNKDIMSNAEAKSFVFHMKNMWKVEKSDDLGKNHQGSQTTSRKGSDYLDANNIAEFLT